LVTKKVGKQKRLFVRLSYADTGAVIRDLLSPFQKPAYTGIQLTMQDTNGDGAADTAVLRARRGNRTSTRTITV
jgi:hypothetical protein